MEEGGGTGLTAHQIYIAMTTGPGSETLDEAQQASAEEAQRQVDRADRIRKLAEKIQAGWQGSAAEGAYGAAGPLADAARDRADHLTVADNLLATQSGVFNSASHSVRPVPEKPPESNILTDMVPWETDLDREIKQYQADVQHNMAVYGMYDGESLSNQERLPREWPAINDPGGTVSVASSGGGPGGPPDGGPGYPLPRPGSGDVSGSSGGSGAGGGSGGPVTPPGARGGEATSQGTGASEYVPPPINPPSSQPPPTGGPAPGSGPVAPLVPVGGGNPGGQVGRGPGAEGGRSGSGPGGPGARGGGGEGGAGGRGSGGGPVVRGPGGPGVGGLTAEEGAARRGGVAGARGGVAGMGGVGALGAGRGQGGEDKEHERKSFLREPDPEAIFGTDEVTAPAVIGEDEQERD